VEGNRVARERPDVSRTQKPPMVGRLLLRLAPLGDRRSEIEDDLIELFARRAREHGTMYARSRYLRDVASLVRPPTAASHTPQIRPGDATMIESLLHDVRYSLRALRRQPAFLAIAAFTLAVGFAANSTVFAVVDRLLLSTPPHIHEADRIARVHIEIADVRGGRFLWYQMPYAAFRGLEANVQGFESLGAYRRTTGSVGTGEDARPVAAIFAEPDYFTTLGVQPQRGRFFRSDEDRPPAGDSVMVLSDAFWQAAFGRDEAIVGRELRLGARTYTVVGITPPGFTGDSFEPVDLWVPLHAVSAEMPDVWTSNRIFRTLSVVGRIRSGHTRQSVAAETTRVYRRISENTPAADPTAVALLGPISPGRQINGALTSEGRLALWLQGVSVLVLVVAVANVITLQISRAAQRGRDTAVRVALGIGRGRLVRQLIVEMLLLGALAGTVALLVTISTSAMLQQLLTPAAGTIAIGMRSILMTAISTVLAAVACGAVAAVYALKSHAPDHLRSGRGGDTGMRSRLRPALLAVQVAVSLALLVGAGLFIRSTARLDNLRFGMEPDRVLVVTAPLRHAGYSVPAVEAFYERALVELAATPGIAGVAAGQSMPFNPSLSAPLFIPGFEQSPFDSRTFPTYYSVTPGHFDTVGMRILRGRGFTTADATGAPPVMILEQALAEHIWPGQEALGRCIRVGVATNPCREIVGIASNTRRFVASPMGAMRFYLPLAQRYATATPQAILIRPQGDPTAAIPAVRAALQRVDPNLPFTQIRVLAELAEPEGRPWRLGSALLTVFGAIALVVASFGVYGLLSSFVAHRTREMGVRLALGASPSNVVRLVVRQSMLWIAAGLAIGLAGAGVGARYVEPLLFETRAYDPVVFAAAPLLLLAVALIASAVPAWRAARVDPNLTLRAE
jgi:predicted permease